MSATTHIRFRGDKRDTWSVSALNQVGPDDQAEIVYRNATYDGYYAHTQTTGQGLTALAGATSGAVKLTKDVTIDQLVGQKMYSYFALTNYTVTGNTAGNAGDVVTVEFTPALGVNHTSNAVVFADVDGPFRFVSESGSDANTGASPWVPKLTIQAAIDAAVAVGATHVQILDSGTYEERLDLKGITVEAASGQTPTILFPFTPFAESASGITASVRQTAEYTINGDPCLYAAAADGLYRSTDGKNWSKVLFSGHALGGVCVWNNECYVFSNTDKNMYKVSDAGSASVFASGTTSGLSGSTVNGGLFAIGSLALYISVGDDPVFSVVYNGAWSTYAGDDTNYPVQIIYDPDYSLDTAYFVGNDLYFGTLSVSTFFPIFYPTVGSKFITYNNGKIYGAFVDSVRVLSSPHTPSIWNEYLSNVAKQSLVQSGVQATGILSLFFDDYGYLHVSAELYGSNITHLISKDNGNTFASSTDVNGMLQSNRQFIRYQGVEIASKSGGGLIEWDRVLVRKGTDPYCFPMISGVVLWGRNVSLDIFYGRINIRYCHARYSYRPCSDVGWNAYIEKTKFSNMKDSDFKYIIVRSCEFYDFQKTAFKINGVLCFLSDSSISYCGVGVEFNANASVTRCIVSGNNIDIKNNSASTPSLINTCYETKTGYEIGEQTTIIGNPLFVDDTNDLTLKSRALGYPVDSALLADADSGSGVDMRESIGARRFSRVLSASSYWLDYTLHCNPGTVRNAFRPANYDKAYSQSGSMYGRETNPSAHKLARTLSWDATGGEDLETKAQAAMLRYIYGLDSVFDVGDSTDGTDFVPRRTGVKVSTFDRVSFGSSDPMIAPNEHAGAWCMDEADTVIGRIAAHTASYLSSGVYVIDITWDDGTDLPAATSTCKIDAFRRFRIDKTQPFAPTCQMPYVPGIISDIPTQYDITLEEVDE